MVRVVQLRVVRMLEEFVALQVRLALLPRTAFLFLSWMGVGRRPRLLLRTRLLVVVLLWPSLVAFRRLSVLLLLLQRQVLT
jgi:hypothetical protein